jgi:hypothetical protein
MEQDMRDDTVTIVKTPIQARQGRLGRPVLFVLVTSMALVIAGFALVYSGAFGGA